MTFGAFIGTRRKAAKLNLRDTAKYLGIAYGYLCDIEQGRRPVHTALAGGSWCGTERQRGGGSGSVLM